MIRHNQGKINTAFVFFDVAIAVMCAYFCYCILNFFDITDFPSNNFNDSSFILYILYIFILVCFHMLFYYRYEFYKSHRTSRFLNELKQISKACLFAFISSQIIAFVFFRLFSLFNGKITENIYRFTYEYTMFFSLANYVTLAAYKYSVRKILKFFRGKGYNLKFLVIVGKNQCTENFIKKIEQEKGFGYRIAGIFGDKSFENIPFLGETDDLDSYMANTLIDEVIITVPDNPELLNQIVGRCNYHGIKFTIILDIFFIFNDKFYIYELDNMISVSTYKIPLESEFNYITKRAFDIMVSIISLIILSPLMIAVAAAIKTTSKGGIIYRQIRMGLNRKKFLMYKFRSMKIEETGDSWKSIEHTKNNKNAENAENAEIETEHKMAEKSDSRCTRIGAFIRKYGIDELPQLFNVLKGNMSLVGPRPELPYHVNHFKDEIPLYMVKHYVKPGISGWAQVNGLRGNTSIEERIKYDIYYIENWSLWFDIKIIFLRSLKAFSMKTHIKFVG